MDTPPKNEDPWKVMKWIGYVYVPVIIVFVLVYLFVQYRLSVSEVHVSETALTPAP